MKRKHRGYGDTFFIDEVFAGVPDHKINGKQHYLWRAVDQDGEVVDVYLQAKRDGAAVTTRQLKASSKGYCAIMAASPERS
jgi:putative transposase